MTKLLSVKGISRKVTISQRQICIASLHSGKLIASF